MVKRIEKILKISLISLATLIFQTPTKVYSSQVSKAIQPFLSLTSKSVKNGIVVTAVLKDPRGNPIPDVPVYFYINSTFGQLKLKAVPTQEDGSASILISGKRRRGDFTVLVSFKGDEKFNPAENSLKISFGEHKSSDIIAFRPPLPPLISFAQFILNLLPQRFIVLVWDGEANQFLGGEIPLGTSITPYPPIELAVVILTIFGTIWSIYFYVLKQVLQIKNEMKSKY